MEIECNSPNLKLYSESNCAVFITSLLRLLPFERQSAKE